MATYSIATSALALHITRKQLENMLGRCRLPGTRAGRQGRARRLRRDTILALAVVLELEHALGLPTTAAAQLAEQLLAPGDPAAGTPSLESGSVTVSLRLDQLERLVAQRLAEALEIAPRPRRGRPAGRRYPRA